MGTKVILLIISVLLAGVLIYHFFTLEGFQSMPVYAQTDIISKCQKYSTCSKCLKDTDCGWAPDYADPVKGVAGVKDGTILACIPQTAGKAFVPSDLANWMIVKNGARTLTNFINKIGSCTDVTCSSMTKCGDCATYSSCAWQQISSPNGVLTQGCVSSGSSLGSGSGSGSGSGLGSGSVNNITNPSMCPPPQCSDITDCVTCANTTGCSFCGTSAKCLKNSEFGSGSNQCDPAMKVDVPSKCPCGGITDCSKCADRVGCGFCKDSSTCVNLNNFGLPPKGTCTPDKLVTSGSQCSSGSGSGSGMLPPKDDVTQRDLDNASNSGNIAVGGGWRKEYNMTRPMSGDVSPPRYYSMNTAPGVARKYSDSSIPSTVRDDGDETPIETYVKMLVNSQLAAQGVPTNEPFQSSSPGTYQGQRSSAPEPFQVNESAAIPNASDYMKKVFRGVFK